MGLGLLSFNVTKKLFNRGERRFFSPNISLDSHTNFFGKKNKEIITKTKPQILQ